MHWWSDAALICDEFLLKLIFKFIDILILIITYSDQAHHQHEMLPTVKEVLLLGLGHKNSRPFLMVSSRTIEMNISKMVMFKF